jgi:hypothetical protein
MLSQRDIETEREEGRDGWMEGGRDGGESKRERRMEKGGRERESVDEEDKLIRKSRLNLNFH